MSAFSDLSGAGEDLLFGVFGGTSVTVAQGSTSVAITDAWKGPVLRIPDPGGGLDLEQVEWRFRASQLTSLVPGPGLTITEGSKVYKADSGGTVDIGQGEIVAVSTWRRVSRGVA